MVWMQTGRCKNPSWILLSEFLRLNRAVEIHAWSNHPIDIWSAPEQLRRLPAVELEMAMCVDPAHYQDANRHHMLLDG